MTEVSALPVLPTGQGASAWAPVEVSDVAYRLSFGAGLTVTSGVLSVSYSYTLPTATTGVLGGVKVDGTTITIASGVISAAVYSLPTASTTVQGGVKVDGSTVTINGSGVISASTSYTLPVATTSVLGGVKVDGTTITIAGGVISAATGGGGTITGVTAGTGLTGGGTTGTVTLAVSFGTTSGTVADGAALAAKASLASPTFTGTPAAPTATGGTNTTQLATTAFVRGEVAALVNSAPGALDTLGEIATQLATDESAAAALTTAVGLKAPIDSPTFTTKITLPSVSADVTTAGAVVYNSTTGRYAFGIGGSAVNHVRLGGDTMTGTLTLSATPSANDNSLKAATTAYADRPFTRTAPGAVPASGGTSGTVNFLREDGVFAVPAGSGITDAPSDGTTYGRRNAAWVAAGGGSTPVTTVATSGASQALAFPSSGNQAYDITLSANCTLTLTGGTAGQRQSVLGQLRGGSTGYTTTWPAGIVWAGGVTPPSLASGSIIEVTLATYDGGTTILGKFE